MPLEDLRNGIDAAAEDQKHRNEVQGMLEESQRKAADLIEMKFPKIIASEYIVELPVGIQLPDNALFNGELINRVTVRRMNRNEKRAANIKRATIGNKIDKEDLVFQNMNLLINRIYAVDPESGSETASYEWKLIDNRLRADIIGTMDIIDEDEIMLGMSAIELGFGNQRDFYASQVFEELKRQQEESFRGTEEEV